MCLSDCQSCKYFDRHPHHSNDIVCGLNPAYTSMWKRLHDLDEYTLKCVPIDECREFELNPELEEKEISLSLSFAAWQTLARESGHPAIIDALKDVLIQLNLSFTLQQWQAIANCNSDPYVRVSLESEGIKPQRYPWIHVDSSCIDAITYLQETSALKIRFNKGEIYQYDHVPHNLFLSLLDADSKGCFFNRHVRDAFPYQLLHL